MEVAKQSQTRQSSQSHEEETKEVVQQHNENSAESQNERIKDFFKPDFKVYLVTNNSTCNKVLLMPDSPRSSVIIEKAESDFEDEVSGVQELESDESDESQVPEPDEQPCTIKTSPPMADNEGDDSSSPPASM